MNKNMGALYQDPPLVQDLKVSIKESSLIFPSQQTNRKSLFLTNIDQVLNFSVETVHFFPPHSHFPPQVVTQKIKTSFSQLLVAYDFLAGRLKICSENNGRLEIDCNGAGAGFVVASSAYSLDEIGDLVHPNPAFHHLVSKSLDGLEPHDHPLVILQVCTFSIARVILLVLSLTYTLICFTGQPLDSTIFGWKFLNILFI